MEMGRETGGEGRVFAYPAAAAGLTVWPMVPPPILPRKTREKCVPHTVR